ncbi:protein SOSEKI 3-like [Triticum urartu]|nr:protein SOSEKI 3-like [Triticum urartu]XP_048569015.1 protein SOSEKI 3-like [Triticum urartu]
MSLEDPRSAMEGRARRRASPSGMRTKAVRVEPEPQPARRHELGTRVAVVYYLCRNHQLEHPHFMEVQLASPQGLYLRDVIGRLDALRGKGMAAKYSWSCKRSYKTGFVWHDLSADDLLLPTQGTEYVLKGSELPFDHSKPLPVPDHQQNNAACADNAKVQPCKPARQQDSPPSPGSSNQGWTSKSPSPTPTTYPAVPVIKEEVPPPPPTTTRAAVVPTMKEVAVPPPLPRPDSPSTPSASTIGDDEQCRIPPHSGSSSNSSPKASMASSDTSSPSPPKPAAAGSDAATQTDDKARWDDVKLQHRQDTARASSSPEGPEIVVDEEESRCTRAPAGENQPRSRRSGTLQSLIRAEAAGRRRCLPLPVEDDRAAAAAAATGGSVSGRLKPANLLMRLMACGPSHPGGFGLMQTSSYKPCFPQLEYPLSPELCPLGALKPAENCSGRLLDGALKRSSSSSRSHQEGVICEEEEEAWPKGFNSNLSRSASKRTSEPSSGRTASCSKVVSFRDE